MFLEQSIGRLDFALIVKKINKLANEVNDVKVLEKEKRNFKDHFTFEKVFNGK